VDVIVYLPVRRGKRFLARRLPAPKRPAKTPSPPPLDPQTPLWARFLGRTARQNGHNRPGIAPTTLRGRSAEVDAEAQVGESHRLAGLQRPVARVADPGGPQPVEEPRGPAERVGVVAAHEDVAEQQRVTSAVTAGAERDDLAL